MARLGGPLPALTRIAIREWWYERLDRIEELDEQLLGERPDRFAAP